MPTSFLDSRNRLLQTTLDFLWRQWTTLGVSGSQTSRGNWIIDPEALVLITTEIGRYDARLLDSAIDWLYAYGQGINLQRLGRLQGQWGPCDERVLNGIAEILAVKSVLRKWRTLRETFPFDEPPEPLFLSPNSTPTPVLGDPDPRFEKYGLLRGQWQPRGNAQLPRPDHPANLLWCLRALFGVNARAEIMAWLLCHESGHPAAIAKDTGYFSKTIQMTLNEMEQSGQIRSERVGREKNFRIRRQEWSHLLPSKKAHAFPRWLHWPQVFSFIFRTLDLLGSSDFSQASNRLRSIQLRGFLDDAAPSLRESGLRSEMTANRELSGETLVEAILQDVEILIHLLDTDFLTKAD